MSEPDARPADPSVAAQPGTGAGLTAAVVGVLITSLPQLIEHLSPWNRAFLALIAVTLGLSVFATVRARREAPRRRLWVTVAVASGVVSGCTALLLGVGAFFATVTPAPVKIGFDDAVALRSRADEDVRVAALPVEPGSYVIWVKLYVTEPEASAVRITCRLEAENDYDVVSADLAPGGSVPMALTVAHTYQASGDAVLFCRHASTEPRTTTLKQVKILAVGAASVRIEFLTR
ncbi:hypothetical protein AB0O47_24520 [Streptomyces noursei]|uniref:hypothetical protein n=1 Tax=Streptomyces noursei TaxID=1971 RepID=UPI00045EFE57|nr:hypothetical protein [Streptomyces noursei]AIA08414.1 hypothetical protein DC74_8008 [Streptomyces noursei]